MPGLSLSHTTQTKPVKGNTNGTWNSQGTQYLNQRPLSPQEQSHGNPASFDLYPIQENQAGQSHGRDSFSYPARSPWSVDSSSTHMVESAEMLRFPSQDSIGAQSQGSTNKFDHGLSTRMYPSVSQMSHQMSSARSDTVRSNSPEIEALYNPNQRMELHAFGNIPYPGGNDFSVPAFSLRGSMPGHTSNGIDLSLTTGSSYNMFSTTGEENYMQPSAELDAFAIQGPAHGDSVIYNPGAIMESPALWDNVDYQESQSGSPVLGDSWIVHAAPIMNANTNSPLGYSPSLEGMSPRYAEDFPDSDMTLRPTNGNRIIRKAIGPRPSKVASDLAAAATRRQRNSGIPEPSEEQPTLIGRSSIEVDNSARDHHFYQNVVPQADGLYHCPWEKEPNNICQHKPEKLKCNYDKCVDSHLKPYKCKVAGCKEIQFSSTACLLRHEREAHGFHGHGDKPFLCTYDGCERGALGNGFPRHWNLRDHMKRVHNDPGQPKSSTSGSPPPSGPTKNKKRKAVEVLDVEVPEKAVKIAIAPVAVKPQPQEPSRIEQYQRQHQALTDLVKRMSDPGRLEDDALFRDAFNRIKAMSQTHQRIQAALATDKTIIAQSG